MFLMRDQDVSFLYSKHEHLVYHKMSDYYAYVRDRITKKLYLFHFFCVIAYFVTSALITIVPLYTYGQSIFSNGKTDSIHAAGFCALTSIVVIHHIQVFLFTRNWTLFNAPWFLLSVVLYPFFAWRNNLYPDSNILHETYEQYMQYPQFWLSFLIITSFVSLPLYAAKAWYFVIAHPEQRETMQCLSLEKLAQNQILPISN
mmetsp:Transcript_38821/g.37164  ORF Transcript_38821/g.37164 Transcript_38821/m.37164 type:complete len:201 (-) Transcript_38821:20-622(-)